MAGIISLTGRSQLHLGSACSGCPAGGSLQTRDGRLLFFAWNWFLYSLGFEQKVEQYDEHIALYVTNTFVRTRFRYPHYMYEENWLFMRSLSDEEQQEAVLKYGDPDDYYREYH